jgi:hypothetical protein
LVGIIRGLLQAVILFIGYFGKTIYFVSKNTDNLLDQASPLRIVWI